MCTSFVQEHSGRYERTRQILPAAACSALESDPMFTGQVTLRYSLRVGKCFQTKDTTCFSRGQCKAHFSIVRETPKNVLTLVKVTSDIQTQNKGRIHWFKGTEPSRCDGLSRLSPILNLPRGHRSSPRQPAILFTSLHN